MLLHLARPLLLACTVLFVISLSAFYAEVFPRVETQSWQQGQQTGLAVSQALKFIVFQPLRTLRVESARQLDEDEPGRVHFELILEWGQRTLLLLLAGLLPCLAARYCLRRSAQHPELRLHDRERHPRHYQYRFGDTVSLI